MKWSWRIGVVAGIGIYLHLTFLILIAWIAWSFYRSAGLARALEMVGFILSVFGCVVLHELGHALMAKRFGIRTRDITLLPIGGVARLERMPDKPGEELLVALAGPAVNVAIALLLFPLAVYFKQIPLMESASASSGDWTGQGYVFHLLSVNVLLVAFNLLPAFPMDGGRVLRALLAFRLDYLTATRAAATVGQGMAFLFGAIGLYYSHLMLMLIAVFVFMGAAQEAAGAVTHTALLGIPVRHAMLTDFRTLLVHERFRVAIDYLLEGSQQDFPVVEEGKVIGILLLRDLMAGLSRQGPEGLVRDAMQTDFFTVDDREMLEAVAQKMQASGATAAPVLRAGQLVGLITQENIGEFLMVQSALRHLREGRELDRSAFTDGRGERSAP